ncbi:MAG: hypothetical protein AAB586_00940 [Patescibacteria group bacterium]
MFQLLTVEEKRKVEREYAIRRSVVMLCAFTSILVVGMAGLFPSYVLSRIRYNEALERTKAVNSTQQRNDDLSLQIWLKETNRKLQLLSPALDTDRPLGLINKVLDQRDVGIAITGFSLIKTKDKIAVSINGVAANRQSLIAFENRLRSSGDFAEVVSPISNLAKDRDIDFQIKFSPI